LPESLKTHNSDFQVTFADSLKVSKFLRKNGSDPLGILAEELGDPFLDYRASWERARTFKELPSFPLHVDYELLSGCNLRCPMCVMGGSSGKEAPGEGSRLSLSRVKALIDEGAELGQRALGFGGLWEPLLSGDIPEIVSYGREKGLIDLMMNTNGTLLSPELGGELIESGLTRLMISLDAATKDTYELMRPGGDFEETEANILRFLEIRGKKRLPLLRLSFCLTKLNEKELIPFLEKWENKADFFSIQSYGAFSGASEGLFPELPFGSPPEGRCAQPFKRLSIRHDGSVLPCCDLSALGLSVGRIENSSLKSVWDGEKISSLREAILRGEEDYLPLVCRECKSKYREK
jgi:radical SAM protein with 4Fe4S-binding SPASM domain